MKVLTQPLTFVTGDVLPPEDLNRLYLYCQDAIADVSEKRWTKGVMSLPFHQDVGTAYTEALTAEELTYRFTPLTTIVIERGFMHANLTSTAEVTFNITRTSDSSTPTGCTVPWLSTAGAINGSSVSTSGVIASATSDTTDVNVDQFVLSAGVEYKIVVSSTGSFDLHRCDIVLLVAVDRWTLAASTSMPALDPSMLTDASFASATVIASNNSALALQSAMFANALTAPIPSVFVKHGGFVSGSDVDRLRFSIPRPLNTRARAVIKSIAVYAIMENTGGTTVTARLRDAAGTVILDTDANVAGVLYASKISDPLSIALAAGSVSPAATGDDYTIEFVNGDASTSCIKAYAHVWIARA